MLKFVILLLLVCHAVAKKLPPADDCCYSDSDCECNQCCYVTPILISKRIIAIDPYPPQRGTCHNYLTEGDFCDNYYFCGCAPTLTCRYIPFYPSSYNDSDIVTIGFGRYVCSLPIDYYPG